MKPCPTNIGNAKVIAYASITKAVWQTGNTVHRFNGQVMGPVPSLAICRYPNEETFYLFYCNDDWQPITDTWHQTLDDAKAQAEFEYQGIGAHWQALD